MPEPAAVHEASTRAGRAAPGDAAGADESGRGVLAAAVSRCACSRETPDQGPGPEARYESREAISLAFVTAVQLLPPNQRAVLLLRDVLGYRAAEIGDLLGLTPDAVTSALKRARSTMAVIGDPGPRRRQRVELRSDSC